MNEVQRDIKRDYVVKKRKAEQQAEEMKDKIYSSIPVLKVIDAQINEKSIELSKQIILSDKSERNEIVNRLKKEIDELREQKHDFMSKGGYSISDITPKYECMECKDTGYVLLDNGTEKICKCLEQNIINKMYKQENLKVEDENFDMFDIGFYSSKSNKAKYGTELSPKDNILYIKDAAMKFIEEFDYPTTKNLAFVGFVGTGKTFLINCIARELINKGKTVVYQTAPLLMDMVMEYKFKQKDDYKYRDQYNKIFNADLLVIDDLGTENLSDARSTELFNILNTRLIKEKKIIISTNLQIDKLFKVYEERIASRIIGNFTVLNFIGDDIRLIKKQLR